MKKELRQLALGAVLASAFTAPAFAQPYLPGHEVASEVVGNTLQGQYRECGESRKDFYEFYKKDGTVHGKERECSMGGNWASYVGNWSVKDGKFCVNFSSGKLGGCYDYEGAGDGKLKRAGMSADAVEFIILDGNPENL